MFISLIGGFQIARSILRPSGNITLSSLISSPWGLEKVEQYFTPDFILIPSIEIVWLEVIIVTLGHAAKLYQRIYMFFYFL